MYTPAYHDLAVTSSPSTPYKAHRWNTLESTQSSVGIVATKNKPSDASPGVPDTLTEKSKKEEDETALIRQGKVPLSVSPYTHKYVEIKRLEMERKRAATALQNRERTFLSILHEAASREAEFRIKGGSGGLMVKTLSRDEKELDEKAHKIAQGVARYTKGAATQRVEHLREERVLEAAKHVRSEHSYLNSLALSGGAGDMIGSDRKAVDPNSLAAHLHLDNEDTASTSPSRNVFGSAVASSVRGGGGGATLHDTSLESHGVRRGIPKRYTGPSSPDSTDPTRLLRHRKGLGSAGAQDYSASTVAIPAVPSGKYFSFVLSAEDKQVVLACLNFIVHSSVLAHGGDFRAEIGWYRGDVKRVCEALTQNFSMWEAIDYGSIEWNMLHNSMIKIRSSHVWDGTGTKGKRQKFFGTISRRRVDNLHDDLLYHFSKSYMKK